MTVENNEPSQIRRTLLSLCGLNPFPDNDSAMRGCMFGTHLTQKLVTKGMTERLCFTGVEQEIGKYTFSVSMPVDGKILKIIPRYERSMGADSINENPVNYVLYEDMQTKEIGVVILPRICSYHQYFGFEYKEKPGLSMIAPGATIPKGTVFLDSPAVTDDGNYMYGAELNIALMTLPGVAEDGIIISEEALKKFQFNTYEVRTIMWGRNTVPLNIYGNKEVYKPFPDIGDCVREDGLLMALRSVDVDLAPVNQSIEDLMKVDYMFDNRIYTNSGGGRVVDIRVTTNGEYKDVTCFTDTQIEKYVNGTKRFYTYLLEVTSRYMSERKGVTFSPELHRLIVEALGYTEEFRKKKDRDGRVSTGKVKRLYKKDPLDEFRLEITIEHTIMPDIGFKFTGCHGDKGVVCKKVPAEHMPVDMDGNRADIVMDPNSRIKRLIIGAMYELYINGASRDVAKRIRRMLNIEAGDTAAKEKVEDIWHSNKQLLDQAWQYLVGYYKIVSPVMYKWYSDPNISAEELILHLSTVCHEDLYLYLPPESAPVYTDVVRTLESMPEYKQTYGPVSYVGNSGVRKTTVNPVRIGKAYFMILEKIGDDGCAVSSSKVQHHGVIAKLTKTDKYSDPIRLQPAKCIGETEGRIFSSLAGRKAIAELMDRNTSLKTHKQICKNILEAQTPTNIPKLIDRNAIPFGDTKPIELLDHILLCAGSKFSYQPQPKEYGGKK